MERGRGPRRKTWKRQAKKTQTPTTKTGGDPNTKDWRGQGHRDTAPSKQRLDEAEPKEEPGPPRRSQETQPLARKTERGRAAKAKQMEIKAAKHRKSRSKNTQT